VFGDYSFLKELLDKLIIAKSLEKSVGSGETVQTAYPYDSSLSAEDVSLGPVPPEVPELFE
jgi:hypothetical protein